ncbi:MAG TPA: MBL fold metallo-hydrolase [Actinomycetes bacterium]|nr:MBL fold metallo-hydrolase [Actinomycetes bacterium]
MRLTVVGCSGSIPGPDSGGSCYLLEHDGFRVVVDMGHGSIGALQRHTALDAVDAIVLSHLHADHCVDLTAFHVAHRYGPFTFTGPVPLYGPSDSLARVAAADGMRSPEPLNDSFDFRDLATAASIGPFRVRAERVAHPVEAYAIRFEVNERTLTYSGDTAPCAALNELAQDVDLLLAEASFVHGADNPPNLHLTGREAGEAARDSGARRLVITHVPPWHDAAAAAAEASEVYDGPITTATPAMTIDLDG